MRLRRGRKYFPKTEGSALEDSTGFGLNEAYHVRNTAKPGKLMYT